MYKIYHKEEVNGHCFASPKISKTEMRYQGLIVLNNIFTADINSECSEKKYQPEFDTDLNPSNPYQLCIFI